MSATSRLPANEVGEIVAKSDGMMTGFWNNEEATRERLVDGWVKTGDLGRIDANGYLYVVDRADDMIISGGYNIWPAEIENAIAQPSGGGRGGGLWRSPPQVGRNAACRLRGQG